MWLRLPHIYVAERQNSPAPDHQTAKQWLGRRLVRNCKIASSNFSAIKRFSHNAVYFNRLLSVSKIIRDIPRENLIVILNSNRRSVLAGLRLLRGHRYLGLWKVQIMGTEIWGYVKCLTRIGIDPMNCVLNRDLNAYPGAWDIDGLNLLKLVNCLAKMKSGLIVLNDLLQKQTRLL